LAKNNPTQHAIKVDVIYKARVLIPILPNVAVSFNPLIPEMILKRTRGIAISLSNRIKISPAGEIQLRVKSLHPIDELNKAHRTPNINPIII
jgi:hypothetical protein